MINPTHARRCRYAMVGILGFVAASNAALAQTAIVDVVTHIEDGDTLCVGSMKVRLEGIDTPEIQDDCRRRHGRWKCGPQASAALHDMVANRTVTCVPMYCDPRGRTVAVCRLDGADIGEAMVRAGWAVDWPYYSDGRYAAALEDARKGERGIWADGGGPTSRIRDRMLQPGSRPKRGPWPPCPTLCNAPPASLQQKFAQ